MQDLFWWRVRFEVMPQDWENVLAQLNEIGTTGVEILNETPLVIEGAAFFESTAFKTQDHLENALAVLEHSWACFELFPIAKENWAQSWQENFSAFCVDERWRITPPWETPEARPGLQDIIIYPEMAFGTGQHATTQLCLRMMANCLTRLKPKSLLDVGTGSGILSFAAAHLGVEDIVGVDNDPDAIKNAFYNRDLNPYAAKVEFTLSPDVAFTRCYEMVVVNMLQSNLAPIESLVLQSVQKGGYLLLSGFLTSEFEGVFAKLSASFRLVERDQQSSPNNEWEIVLWQKI